MPFCLARIDAGRLYVKVRNGGKNGGFKVLGLDVYQG